MSRLNNGIGMLLIKGFLLCSSLIFSIAAMAKLFNLNWATVAPKQDPVFPFLSVDQISILAAIIETGIAIYIVSVWQTKPVAAVSATAWLSAIFLSYRGALNFSPTGGCMCLGIFGSFIGADAGQLSNYLLTFLSVGSVACLGYLIFTTRSKICS